MTALTEAHLKKLTDEDLRAIALRILTDAVSALDTSIEEYDLTDHPDLDPAPVHEAADWLRKALTNPDDESNHDTWKRHRAVVLAFWGVVFDVGKSTTGNSYTFPPNLNADAVLRIFNSVYHRRGTPHRPSTEILRNTLTPFDDGFFPSHETTIGYVLKAICGTADPRLPALAESYLQSGLYVGLRPAIDEAEGQLARLDELADLNR